MRQQIALVLQGFHTLLGFFARAARGLPVAPQTTDFFGQSTQPGMPIQQFALRVSPQQRLMGVLTMNIGKEVAELAQLGGRGRRTVDVGP